MKKAFIKGYRAAISGKGGMSSKYPCGSKQAEHWNKGWITGFIEMDLNKGKPSKRIPKSF